MDKQSKYGRLSDNALNKCCRDYADLIKLLKSNKGLNDNLNKKADQFIKNNKFCFDNAGLCSGFDTNKGQYFLADPRFLAGKRNEAQSDFYSLKINKNNEYTFEKVSFENIIEIQYQHGDTLRSMDHKYLKEEVLRDVFGMEDSVYNESAALFNEFKEYVRKTEPDSESFLKAAENSREILFKDNKGNTADRFTGQKMMFMDPRVQSGLIDPNSPEAAFYFVKQDSPDSKPKFEKASFNDVLDFVVRDDMKNVKKPHRGFWGTIRDWFGKDNDGRKKYEREKEVYYANKCYILEQRFGMKNLEYNHDLTDTAKANKYINDRINAAVDKKVKNESITPSAEKSKPVSAAENKDRDFDLDDDYLQLTDEMIKKRDIALQRLDMLAESGEKTAVQGALTIKALFGINLKFEDDKTCKEVRDLADRVINCMSQPIGKDSTKWEDHPKWDEMKDFCKYIGLYGDVSGQTPDDIRMNVSRALEAREEKLKKPVSITDLVVHRLDAIKQNEDSYIRSGADEIKKYIINDPDRKTDGCKLMINFFAMTKGDAERQNAFCEHVGNRMAYHGEKVNDIVSDLLNPDPDKRLESDDHLSKIHEELSNVQHHETSQQNLLQ